MRISRLSALGVTTVLAVSAAVTLASPATASTSTSKTTSCYASGCTGLNPSATRCQDDAETLMGSSSGDTSLELRYSPSCRATWARITYSRGTGYIRVKNSNGDSYTSSVNFTGSGTVYTRMVNDKDITSWAEYVWDGGNQWDSTGAA